MTRENFEISIAIQFLQLSFDKFYQFGTAYTSGSLYKSSQRMALPLHPTLVLGGICTQLRPVKSNIPLFSSTGPHIPFPSCNNWNVKGCVSPQCHFIVPLIPDVFVNTSVSPLKNSVGFLETPSK